MAEIPPTETILTRISPHVYWMNPGPPDRPSLCAVVGARTTLMLDAAASAEHMRLFLAALRAQAVPAPRLCALTHWHWDHVFGGVELGVPVIAHRLTAEQLALQAGYAWDDTALDARVASGEEIAFCADNIRLELPAPRKVEIALPDIVFEGALTLDLGGVTCQIQHVGGDHAQDSCVMFIPEDRLLFLGDCLYDAIYAPTRHYTTARLFPLLTTILRYDAELFVEGHTPTVRTRAQIETMAARMRLTGMLFEQIGADEAAILAAVQAHTGALPDEDEMEFVRALIAGRAAVND